MFYPTRNYYRTGLFRPRPQFQLRQRAKRNLTVGLSTISVDAILTEGSIQQGGREIVIQLTGRTAATFVDGSTYLSNVQDLIDGITSAQSEALGWNKQVRDKLRTVDVIRQSDKTIRVFLPASTGYLITASEVITVTIPASMLSTSDPIVGSQTFGVTVSDVVGTSITNSESTSKVPINYEICDRSGFRVKRNGLRTEWHGIMVRPKSFESRNAQDFVSSRAEKQEGSERPEQPDRFIGDDIAAVQASDL